MNIHIQTRRNQHGKQWRVLGSGGQVLKDWNTAPAIMAYLATLPGITVRQ